MGVPTAGRKIAFKLMESVTSGKIESVYKCAVDIYQDGSGFSGVFRVLNSRIRNVTEVRDLESLPGTVSSTCGNLSNFVWLVWAGLNAICCFDIDIHRGI